MQKQENNFAFIDSQNLNLGIKSCGWFLDWAKLRVYLKEKYGVTQAYLFIGYIESNSHLYQALQKNGFILIFKPTLRSKDGRVKGNCDAELVLQTMIDYDKYEQAVVVSGDGDFACLVDYLTKKDKLKKVLVPNRKKYSSLLKKPSKGKIAFVSDLKNKLEFKKK